MIEIYILGFLDFNYGFLSCLVNFLREIVKCLWVFLPVSDESQDNYDIY